MYAFLFGKFSSVVIILYIDIFTGMLNWSLFICDLHCSIVFLKSYLLRIVLLFCSMHNLFCYDNIGTWSFGIWIITCCCPFWLLILLYKNYGKKFPTIVMYRSPFLYRAKYFEKCYEGTYIIQRIVLWLT